VTAIKPYDVTASTWTGLSVSADLCVVCCVRMFKAVSLVLCSLSNMFLLLSELCDDTAARVPFHLLLHCVLGSIPGLATGTFEARPSRALVCEKRTAMRSNLSKYRTKFWMNVDQQDD
jgi:hypothetical protein